MRFVPRRDVTGPAPDEAQLYVEYLPEEPAEIAAQLFNARDSAQSGRASRVPPPPGFGPSRTNGASDIEDPAVRTRGLGIVGVVEKKDAAEPSFASTDWAAELKKNERKQRKLTAAALVATALFILVFGGLAVVWVGTDPHAHEMSNDSAVNPPKMKSTKPNDLFRKY